ncbi:MAG TPA: hypothetical protein VGL42_12885 [Opitutaceae bacterium]|jgi:hypothetical protein
MNELNRLLGAIEQLLDAEGAALRHGNVLGAAALQERGAPVIRRLVEIAAISKRLISTPGPMAERFQGVREKRRENLDLLVALRAERETLRSRLADARVHMRRVNPAYGQKKVAVPRFSAAV